MKVYEFNHDTKSGFAWIIIEGKNGGDYSDVIGILAGYGITEEEIDKAWPEYWNLCVENDYF